MKLTMTVDDKSITASGSDEVGQFDINGDVNGNEFSFVK